MTRKLDAVQREKGALEQVRRRPTEQRRTLYLPISPYISLYLPKVRRRPTEQRRDRVAIEEERQAEA